MRTLEEIRDDEITANMQRKVSADGVIFPDDLNNRLLYHILVQLERIANSLFMANQISHEALANTVTATISNHDVGKILDEFDKCCVGENPVSPNDIKPEWPHEWTDEEIKHSRENPDPLDLAEEG